MLECKLLFTKILGIMVRKLLLAVKFCPNGENGGILYFSLTLQKPIFLLPARTMRPFVLSVFIARLTVMMDILSCEVIS